MEKMQSKLLLSFIDKDLLDLENLNSAFKKNDQEIRLKEEEEEKRIKTQVSLLETRLQGEIKKRNLRLNQLNSQKKDNVKTLNRLREKKDLLNIQVGEKKKSLMSNIQCINDHDLISYKLKLTNLFNAISLKMSQKKQDFKQLLYSVSLYERELGIELKFVAKATVILRPRINYQKPSSEYIKLRTHEDAISFECIEVSQILDSKLVEEYLKKNDIHGLFVAFMKKCNT